MMEEAPDAWRSSPPVRHSSRRDAPPEAATPHAPLSLLKGGALTTAPGTARPRVCARCRRAAARRDTRLTALLERPTAMMDGAVFPR
jgi:hypothetical protein